MHRVLRILGYSFFFVLVLLGCQSKQPHSQQPLSAKWQFKSFDSLNWLSASVPGVVQTDLLAVGLIPDPFLADNEDSVQWVENTQWEYRTTFSLTKEQQKYDNVDLVFDGLDTYAQVFINDKPVLNANNMFRQWRINLKEELLGGENELRVVFTPPIQANKHKLEKLGYRLPAGSETGKWPVSPFTRKAAYQFGWDFAPRLVTMGIWQPVYLDFWSSARIENVHFEQTSIDNDKAVYKVVTTIYSNQREAEYRLDVLQHEKIITLKKGLNTIAVDVTINTPKLWWPNGWGEQNLYEIPVKLFSGDIEIDKVTKQLGIRTVELVQEEDTIGKSFYFKVNGKKFFAKGANWSPLGSYPSAVDDTVYVNRLKAVKNANMNMLRIWGGGIYERDLFYELCDEYGIFIWQDFMFANSMHPGDTAFVENVKQEVKEQIVRLRTHPSLALWNGNNEIDVAWKNWGWQNQFGYSNEDSSEIWHNYLQLFHQEIPELVEAYDSGRPYTTTSPLSNWGNPENFNKGSMHYWGVWHGGDSFEDYKNNVGRFMVEYGFQSFPDIQTVKKYAGEGVIDLDSSISHQKSYVGNSMITKMATKYYGKPSGFPDFIQKSQQTQALAYKIAIEAHRLNKDKCGGTLFWQLNDCWPGPSWSVIDYYGNKKAAYDVVADRFKPVILIVDSKNNDFTISVVNDKLTSFSGILKIELYNYDDSRLWVTEKEIEVNSNKVKSIYRSDNRKLLDGMPAEEVYLKASLQVDSSMIDIEKFYFVLPKDFKGTIDLVGKN